MKKLMSNWQRKNIFGDMVYLGDQRKQDSSDIPRVYVLVRSDLLPPLHQGIQAAHACLLLASKIKVDPNSYLIILSATHEQMVDFMKRKKPVWAAYFDKGLIDIETNMPLLSALAFEPMSLIEGQKLFSGFKRSE